MAISVSKHLSRKRGVNDVAWYWIAAIVVLFVLGSPGIMICMYSSAVSQREEKYYDVAKAMDQESGEGRGGA